MNENLKYKEIIIFKWNDYNNTGNKDNNLLDKKNILNVCTLDYNYSKICII